MTSTVANIVAPGGITIIGNNSAPLPQVLPLYTLAGIYSERIDSVYMTIDQGSNDETNNVFAVQLVAPNGAVLYEQATPPQLGVDAAVLVSHLVWSRLGNDTAQLASAEALFASDDVRRSWCNMRLPDIVLPPLSVVNLLAYIDNGGEFSDYTVTDASITTTRNAGAVSSTQPLAPFPLLTPTDEG